MENLWGDISFGLVKIKEAHEEKISDWLDKRVAENLDVSQVVLPVKLSYEEVPDETIFFEEINHDGILSTADHPFSTVERFGHWYYCPGLGNYDGIHSSKIEGKPFAKDKDFVIRTAKEYIE